MTSGGVEPREDVLRQVAELAEKWAHQPSDYDEDTEQQIADGNELLILLRAAGVDAAEPSEPHQVDSKWVEHLSHPTPLRRAVDGLLPVEGCKFCTEGRP